MNTETPLYWRTRWGVAERQVGPDQAGYMTVRILENDKIREVYAAECAPLTKEQALAALSH
jgi:hypothetical protein